MLQKRSFSLSGHRTSVALEPEFWATLEAMAADRQQTMASLVASLDATRQPSDPLASLLRVSALRFAQIGLGPANNVSCKIKCGAIKESATKPPA